MNRLKRDLIRVLVILLGFAIINLVQGVAANAEAPSETVAVDYALPVQHEAVQPGRLVESFVQPDAREVPSGGLLRPEWPYGCVVDFTYGGTSGYSQCSGGTGSHRVRLSCRDRTNGVVYYVYGGWRPTGWQSYKYSWAYCTSLGKPSYVYDAIDADLQLRSW